MKGFMPGSEQWQVLTKQRDECWICSQQIFTIFLWSTRIGQINSVNREQSDFYINQIKRLEEDDIIPNIYEVPHIGGPFNEWLWTPMRKIVEFCIDNDPKPPDFIQMMIETK